MNKKQLKREYQQTHPRMGIWQIRNLTDDRVLIGSSLNLPGILNRTRLQLQMGSHQSAALQADWNQYGSENFAFEILDELTPSADPQHDHRADLAFLEELWLEKLQPYGERGYNERKKSREEKLRQIASRRLQER
ncbi:MAG TPA: GIY-YIG nuclease family protein [Blastocatellia bacterium]|nr:GIY-YIG nuclease family protein [Blastocatellia bacterium]